MRTSPPQPTSGHVFKVERMRGPQGYAKYRLPNGRQVQKRIGPHWGDRRTSPPAGYFTKATARAWLDDTLAKARRGELPGQVKTGTTLLAAFDDWLVYKRDRKIKLSTQIDYENMVTRYKKVFGEKFGSGVGPEEVTPEMVEEFRDALIGEGLSDRTVNKYLTVLHGVFVWAQRRYKLAANPVCRATRVPRIQRGGGGLNADDRQGPVCPACDFDLEDFVIGPAPVVPLQGWPAPRCLALHEAEPSIRTAAGRPWCCP